VRGRSKLGHGKGSSGELCRGGGCSRCLKVYFHAKPSL
jgi:hypothetical protein